MAVKYIGAQRPQKPVSPGVWLFLSLIGNVVLFLGLVSWLVPDLVFRFFNETAALELQKLAPAVIVVGLIIELFAVAKFIRAKWLKQRVESNENPPPKAKRSSQSDEPLLFNIEQPEIAVSWKPLKSGGVNFKTHELFEKSANRLEFRPSRSSKLFLALFAGLGLFSSMAIVIESKDILPSLIGLVFFFVGVFFYSIVASPRTFDKSIQRYWKGRVKNESLNTLSQQKEWVNLDEVVAIQIIKEYVKTSKSRYNSYEINLVLKDGKRFNVVDHGHLKTIENHAEKLAQFLAVPLLTP